jgi:GH15 family glucan-1,4-alpha-glucosidase
LSRFLPYDERVVSTIEMISKELTEDGLVLRYRTDESDDGLSGREGFFLVCSFWLVEALHGSAAYGRLRSSSSGCSSSATTSGCSARSMTPGLNGWSATCPRR